MTFCPMASLALQTFAQLTGVRTTSPLAHSTNDSAGERASHSTRISTPGQNTAAEAMSSKGPVTADAQDVDHDESPRAL